MLSGRTVVAYCRIIKFRVWLIFVDCLNFTGLYGRNFLYSLPTKGMIALLTLFTTL